MALQLMKDERIGQLVQYGNYIQQLLQEMERVKQALLRLCVNEDLKVAVIEASKGGAIAGVAAFFGGIALGPVGAIVGAGLGGLVGMAVTDTRSIIPILKKLTNEEWQELIHRIRDRFNFGGDLVQLAKDVLGSEMVKRMALQAIAQFMNERGFRVLL